MILLTGASGMLGSAIQNELKNNKFDYLSLDIKGKNDYIGSILDKELLKTIFKDNQIDCIINCAAWTNVDSAEEEANKEEVFKCNVIGVENLCNLAKKYNSKLIHISTDYVFDGSDTKPWDENDIPRNPVNYYGETKLRAEQLVQKLDKFFIVRTQWTYGQNGKNFVDTMVEIGKTQKEVKVVNDQFGSPTCVYDLSKVLIEMIDSNKYGYYHVVSSGDYVSWYEICKKIFNIVGLKTKIISVSSEEYTLSKVKRPKNSRLNRAKYINAGFNVISNWDECLIHYLKNKKKVNYEEKK